MTAYPDQVVVERIIAAPPEQIFPLLADTGRHREIDGSGAVRDPRRGSQKLVLGSRWTMAMRMGIPYAMVNTVIDYQENRRIAWQTRGPTALGRWAGGRIWRYDLEPTEGGTRVTETWDISQESAITRPMVRAAGPATAKNMTATLARIAELVEN